MLGGRTRVHFTSLALQSRCLVSDRESEVVGELSGKSFVASKLDGAGRQVGLGDRTFRMLEA